MARSTSDPHPCRVVESFADWALYIRVEEIGEAALKQAKLLCLDTLGGAFPAREEESVRAVTETVEFMGGAPHCTIIGGAKTSLPNAVLANGVLIRALDLNDYTIEPGGNLGGHPSDNIPVALAAGELSGRPGREVLAAIVVGYEVYRRIKSLMERRSAWDGVSVSGIVAPVMAGRLLGLDALQLANAIALSLSRAATSAVVRAGDISSAKSIANALVAQTGVQAALLARYGVTGPLAILEHPRGMKAVFPGFDSVAALTAPLPVDSAIMNAHVKVYPCVATGQAAVAAALEMHRLCGGDIERLRRIRIVMAERAGVREQQQDAGRINPLSREAADHSFNFLVAISLLDGAFGLAQFEGERWRDPNVRELMGRIDMTTDADLAHRAPNAFPCAIVAEDADGSEIRVEVLVPPGFSRAGLNDATVIKKFNALTASHLDAAARERIIDSAMRLDVSGSVTDLLDGLARRNSG